MSKGTTKPAGRERPALRRRERVPMLEGETLVFELRGHWHTLTGAALVLLLATAVASFLAATVPDSDARPTLRLIIAGAAAAVTLRWSLWPFLDWYAHSYVLTTRRLIIREGVFARRGLDIPLGRVVGASVTRSLLQRMFGCGRLTLATAGQRGDVVIDDVPLISDVQQAIAALCAVEAQAAREQAGHELPGGDVRDRGSPRA